MVDFCFLLVEAMEMLNLENVPLRGFLSWMILMVVTMLYSRICALTLRAGKT
jgi:hypothetical protein